jgi:hypothetical protein
VNLLDRIGALAQEDRSRRLLLHVSKRPTKQAKSYPASSLTAAKRLSRQISCAVTAQSVCSAGSAHSSRKFELEATTH